MSIQPKEENVARLVIVSNRVTAGGKKGQAPGGLATALKDVLTPETIWFGWSGKRGETSGQLTHSNADGAQIIGMDLAEKDFSRFYVGFANRTLWPLLHYRPGLLSFDRSDYEGYLSVNNQFADALMQFLRPDDIVWVHDYHFIPLAACLRQRNFTGRIGFYLHIPFVPPALFSVLPPSRALLSAMCEYDHVGFQTETDVRHFRACVMEILRYSISKDGVIFGPHRPCISSAIPVGIDTEGFAVMAAEAEHKQDAERLRESMGDKALILGVDRLDYSKGLLQRFIGYGRLLEKHPEHRQHVGLLQIAPRSRDDVKEYRDVKRQLDQLVGQINGQHADFDWVPIRYLTRDMPRSMLAGFHRVARVGLVTPLRDGMNLVAKEFVAAQNPADPGVLVLSRFAGAAAELQDALLINPFDPDEIAEALHAALTMPLAERQARWRRMYEIIHRNSASAWSQACLQAVLGHRQMPVPPSSRYHWQRDQRLGQEEQPHEPSPERPIRPAV